jgi:hypothetical protein
MRPRKAVLAHALKRPSPCMGRLRTHKRNTRGVDFIDLGCEPDIITVVNTRKPQTGSDSGVVASGFERTSAHGRCSSSYTGNTRGVDLR